MNNSRLIIDNLDIREAPEKDRTPELRKRQEELTRIIENLNAIAGSAEWKELKADLLDGVVETIDRRLLDESKKKEPDLKEIYRLQGQLVWARKYSKLEDLGEAFKVELKHIKDILKNG